MFVPQVKKQEFKAFKEEIVLEGHNLGDFQCPSVDIESSWRDEIEEVDVGMQTIRVETKNSSAQSTYFKEIDVQTDDAVLMQIKSGVADASLNPFLGKVTPLMEECLAANDRSTAFEKSDAMTDDTQKTVDEVHSLSMFDHNFLDLNSTEKVNPHDLVCTSTSWNSTGYVLAVAYGRFDVSGWTEAPGHLCTWNLGVRNVNAKKPDVLIDLDNPLQCITFHPTHPALIAGGTLNGELYVWDLSQEDPLRGKSRITDFSHREPITQVVWQFNAAEASKHSAKENAFQVITLSSDGRILIWNWMKMDHPVFAYELMSPHPKTKKLVVWGGTSLSFHSNTALTEDQGASLMSANQGTFVVGTDGGTVYRCMFQHNSASEAEFAKNIADKGAPKFRNPIKGEYKSHAGPVHAVACSPFQRNIFCTSGIDGTVRIYHLLQPAPLILLEPSSVYLHGVQFSPFRPLVFAAATGDGRIAMYDLYQSRVHPARMIDVCGKAEPVYSFAFNGHLREYLAATAGDSVKVFELGDSFTEARGAEQRALNHLADAEFSGKEE